MMSFSDEIPLEVRQKYIERRKTDLEDCKIALQKKDFDTLARVGHQVKGNAESFGFDGLSPIAIDMENYALKKDSQNLDLVIARFAQFLSNTLV